MFANYGHNFLIEFGILAHCLAIVEVVSMRIIHFTDDQLDINEAPADVQRI